METMKCKYLKLWFCGIIIIGLLSSLASEIIVHVLFDSADFIEAIKFVLNHFVSPIFLLFSVWNTVPFIALAILANYQLSKSVEQDSRICIKIIASIIVAAIMGFSTSIFIQFDAWSAAFRGEPGTSTTPLIYIFLPFPVSIVMVVGYGLGWVIGKLILWNRSRK